MELGFVIPHTAHAYRQELTLAGSHLELAPVRVRCIEERTRPQEGNGIGNGDKNGDGNRDGSRSGSKSGDKNGSENGNEKGTRTGTRAEESLRINDIGAAE